MIFTDLTVHMLMVILLLFPVDDDDAKVIKKQIDNSVNNNYRYELFTG